VTTRPTYVRIADDLRREIADGRLPPGTRLPSRARLAALYSVSDRVAFEAIRLLVAEGFVETRSGSGSYVRSPTRLRSLTRTCQRERHRASSPVCPDLVLEGSRTSTETDSHRTDPPRQVATRLGLQPTERVMRTVYRYVADGDPMLVCTSWEPLTITGGSPILLPERGPLAGQGVVERMGAIGVEVTHLVENIVARPLRREEADQLQAQPGRSAIVIERTHFAGEQAVETAEIVIPGDRYQVSYQLPITRD
jgi:DNA-binding GntR family transcriptional regulator